MFNKQTLNGYLKYFGIQKLKIYSPRYFIDLVSAREFHVSEEFYTHTHFYIYEQFSNF